MVMSHQDTMSPNGYVEAWILYNMYTVIWDLNFKLERQPACSMEQGILIGRGGCNSTHLWRSFAPCMHSDWPTEKEWNTPTHMFCTKFVQCTWIKSGWRGIGWGWHTLQTIHSSLCFLRHSLSLIRIRTLCQSVLHQNSLSVTRIGSFAQPRQGTMMSHQLQQE